MQRWFLQDCNCAMEAQLPLKCQRLNGQIWTLVLTFHCLQMQRWVCSDEFVNHTYIPLASVHLPLEPSILSLQQDRLEQVSFNCLATQRLLDKCCNSFPPPDAQCLWGWMEQWAGLGWTPGFCMMIRGMPFWSTAMLRYTASLERWELGPVTDFASKVVGDKLQYFYLLGKILWPFTLFIYFTGNEISPLTNGCGTFSILYISFH